MAFRTDVLARDGEIRSSKASSAVLAARYGLSAAHIARIRQGVPRERTRKEQFELEVIQGGWVAACMEPDEWAIWLAENPTNIGDGFAERPCRDCPASFADEMRSIGRCNGMPTGGEGEPAEHNEEERDVIDRPSAGVRANQALELVPPPCATCLHEPVCVLKIALRKATTAEVTAVPLPDGLSVAITARVDCRFYNRAKGTPVKRNWSPEQRQAAAERLNAARAAKAPKAVAEP